MIYVAVFLFLSACGFVAFEWIKWLLLVKAVQEVPKDAVDQIIFELAKVGSTESKSFFLCAGNRNIHFEFSITLPNNMDVLWLCGKTVRTKLNQNFDGENDLGKVWLESPEVASDFRLAPIPRVGGKGGKGSNRYQPKYWFKKRDELRRIVLEIYPRDPEGFLSLLLDRNGRVNAPFDWLQSPPPTKCKTCRKKLLPVYQVWGGAVGLDGDTAIFLAACNCTPDAFYIFAQSS